MKDLNNEITSEIKSATATVTESQNNETEQYHLPKDLEIIAKQKDALQLASQQLEEAKRLIEEKNNLIQEKDKLIADANNLISKLDEENKSFSSTEDEIRKKFEADKSSEIIQSALIFAEDEKNKAVQKAQKQAEEILENAKREADEIILEANNKANEAKEREDIANSLYLEICSKLELFKDQIKDVLKDQESLKLTLNSKKEYNNTNVSDVKSKENNAGIDVELSPEWENFKLDSEEPNIENSTLENNKQEAKIEKTPDELALEKRLSSGNK